MSIRVPYPLRLTLLYAILGGVWIISSDRLAAWIFPNPQLLLQINTYKGWFFIIVTAILLYLELNREYSHIKQATAARQESEKRYQTLAQISPVGIFQTDADGATTYVNPKWCAISGLPAEQALGDGWLAAVHPDDQEKLSQTWQASTQSQRVSFSDYRFVRPDGTLAWVMGRAVPEINSENQVIGYVGTITDITERKRTEQKLAENERNYRNLIQNLQIGLVVHAPDTSVLFSNLKASQLLGLTPDQMCGKAAIDPDWCFVQEDGARMPLDQYPVNQALTTETPITDMILGIIRPDQEGPTWVQCNAHQDLDLDGKLQQVVVTFADITQRKLADERLAQSHELLANLARLVPGVIYQYLLYPDGRSAFPYASPGINDIYEVMPEDVQEDASPVFGRLHPDDYDHVANTIQESARTLNEFYCEFRVILPRQGLRWRSSQAHPERTDDGGTIWHGIISDITESKQAQEKIQQLNAELEKRVEERTRELRDTQEQLVQQERLAVLGRLAGGLAHELRNPLGIINNAIYYLRIIQQQAEANVQEYLGIIETETRNANKIVSTLLDFSSDKLADVEPVAVSSLVNQVLERFPAPEGVDVKLEIPENLPNVYTDPRHITQILGNLVVNAYQAMPNGGELRVSSEQRMENREQRAESGEQPVGTEPLLSTPLLSNNWILITIRDSGVGITPENMQKLFEPLFTTKAKGIGLGLAVSKKLIETNGGKIAAESEPGKGSKFTVYLPVTN